MIALGLLAGCGGGQDDTAATAAAGPEGERARILAAPSTLPVKLPEIVNDQVFAGLVIPADAPTRGMWSGVQSWPMNAIHVALLPNGRVLSYGAPVGGDSQNGRTFDVWDPSQGFGAGSHVSSFEAGRNDSFCSTANVLADGRLLISGGNTSRGSTLFSYGPQTSTTDSFTLADDRWYASLVKMADGRLVMLGGIDPYTEGQQNNPDAAVANGQASMTPELYIPGTGWRSLTGARSRDAFGPDYLRSSYPHAWAAPNGRVFGISAETMWTLDANANGGQGAISILGRFKGPPNASNPVNNGGTSGAVMFAPGRILVAGGNGSFNGEGLPASAAATIVDINGANPVLTETQPMRFARRYGSATVLPDGKVVMTGGTRFANNGGGDAVYAAEIWNPATGAWTLGPNAARIRVYHSNAILLPSGVVLSLGGGTPGPVFNLNAEAYYPPYLFTTVNGQARLATRPVMTGLSALGFAHGATGVVEMKTSAAVARLVLVANGTATHNFNNTQRHVPLAFTQSGDRLSFTLPASGNDAPPGYYQLVALDAAGVPSVGTIVAVGAGVAAPPAPPSGSGTGLLGTYFNSRDLSGAPVLQRTEAVNFDFGTAAPAGTVLPPDNFSIRWSGEVEAVETGSVQFRTNSDDGVRVYVGGQLVIDNWTTHAPTLNTSAPVGVTAGQRVPIVVEYQETGGPGIIQLSWLRPGNSWAIVPATQLYPQPFSPPPGQPASTATTCGNEGQNCAVPVGKIATLWFGAGNAWRSLSDVTGTLACTVQVFGGDPAPGVVKSCRYLVTADIQPAAGAAFCANQNQSCVLPANTVATVWYGADTRWTRRTGLSGSVGCNDANFGNAAGTTAKTCRYQVTSLAAIGAILAPPVRVGTAASWAPGLDNAGTTFSWNFGDGSPATGFVASSAASRVFTEPGLYTVTLTARNTASGATTSKSFFQAVFATPTAGAPRHSSAVLLEPRTAASTRLWVVNPDNDSVGVIDTATNARVAEITVGTGPRTLARAADGRIWVVNRDGASISIVNPATLAVAQTIALPSASQPHGIVIAADGTTYVTLEARAQLLKLSAAGAMQATLSLPGTPRHLALSANGSRLYVSRFITPAMPGEATALVNTAAGAAEVAVVDTAALTLQATVPLRHSDRTDAENQGSGIPNYLGAPAISPDGTSAWVPSKQDNVRRGRLRSNQELDFQNSVRAVSSRIDLATLAENPAQRADHDNASLASAAAYDATGSYLFVALETSRQVEVLNARTGQLLFRFDVGLAPQGLVASADNSRLYVQNFMGRSLSVVDLSPLTRNGELRVATAATVATLATDKLPATVLQGKRLFYDARDPRLARDSYMSCASCHNDGGHDGRTWDFTGFGEGLRNTPSLRGRAGMGQGFAHWTANFDEIQDFEGQIRAFAGGTGLMSDAQFNTGTRSQPLGDRKSGLSADLDALAAYVASLSRFDASPRRNADRTLTAAAQAGRTVFQNANCASCHAGTAFTLSGNASAMKNVGTLKPGSGNRLGAPLTALDVPTLRDLWATAPYLHDGSAATLAAAVQAHAGNPVASADLANLVAYLEQIGSEEATAPVGVPGVGNGSGLRAEYFDNFSLQGQPVLSRVEVPDFNWGTSSPGPGVPADNFSVRWSGEVQAVEAGSYQFRTNSDDGVRVWVNGALVIDNWTPHGPTLDTSSSIALAAGQRVSIVVEFQEYGGGALLQLSWLRPGAAWAPVPASQLIAPGAPPAAGSGTGLQARYFANADLQGTAVLSRVEAPNFDWGSGSPGAAVPADFFSARWSGEVQAIEAGNHQFRTNSDDGVRVWVNGTLVIDNWTPHGPTLDTSAAITLAAGQRVSIVVEFQEYTGGAVLQLSWLRPGAGWAAVPVSQLYPASP